MHVSLCVCALIPRLSTRTTLLLVMHRTEDKKSTNTGRLATEALENSRIVLRGGEHDEDADLSWSPDTRPLLLFPAGGAEPLDTLASIPGDDRPVTLIVPDGNWRQASKVHRRVASLRDVPCVTLRPGEPSVYRLRSEAQVTGLATLEAIARALAILEGDAGPAVERALLAVFRAMVERTLWSRGAIDLGEVTDGVAEGVRRDQPWARPA
jgi:DTW domain-containing protein